MSSTGENPTISSTMTDLADAVRYVTGKEDKLDSGMVVSALSRHLSGGLRDREIEFIERTPTAVYVPSGMTEITAYAFSGCSSLSYVEIPEGVTSIGPGAFAGCTALSSIVIPSSVISIGEDAFLGCSIIFILRGDSDSLEGMPWGAVEYSIVTQPTEDILNGYTK